MTRLSIFAVFSLDFEEALQTIFLHRCVRAAEYLEKNLANCFDGIFCLLSFYNFSGSSVALESCCFERFFACELFSARINREVTSRDKYLRQGQMLGCRSTSLI